MWLNARPLRPTTSGRRGSKGAKVIVRTRALRPFADVRSVPAGEARRDAALFAGVLNLIIETRMDRSRVHRQLTVGFENLPAYCGQWTLEKDLRGDRRASTIAPPGGGMVGHSENQLSVSRPGHRAPFQRRTERARHDQSRARLGRIGKPKSGYGTIVGQANGQGGREHGQKCDQLPGWRDIANPEHRKYIAGVWDIDERSCRAQASMRTRCSARSTRARSRGLLSICFNPKVSLPDSGFISALPRQTRILRLDRLLPERHRAARRYRAARQPARRR